MNTRFDSVLLKQKADEQIDKKLKSNDSELKRSILISKINENERSYFEKPTRQLRDKIDSLKKELKQLNVQMKSKKSRNASVEKYYNKGKERRQLYGFKEGRKLGGIKDEKSNIHARTIGKPINMWSAKEDSLK